MKPHINIEAYKIFPIPRTSQLKYKFYVDRITNIIDTTHNYTFLKTPMRHSTFEYLNNRNNKEQFATLMSVEELEKLIHDAQFNNNLQNILK